MKHPSMITVPCPGCGGSGSVGLPYAYRVTYEALLRTPRSRDGSQYHRPSDLAAQLKVGRTALCNRLAWLERHRLAERADFGVRDQRWRAIYR